jgi:hypothetical protein
MSDVLIEQPNSAAKFIRSGWLELRLASTGLFSRKKWARRYFSLNGTLLTISVNEVGARGITPRADVDPVPSVPLCVCVGVNLNALSVMDAVC